MSYKRQNEILKVWLRGPEKREGSAQIQTKTLIIMDGIKTVTDITFNKTIIRGDTQSNTKLNWIER